MQDEYGALLARVVWAGELRYNGGPPVPSKPLPFKTRWRMRLKEAWYRWGPRFHLGDCGLHCGCLE